MQLAPIGISDLVAAGVRSFPIAQPVADVVRASNQSVSQLSPVIALQSASTSQSTASENSQTGQATESNSAFSVSRDEFTPSIDNPLAGLLTAANVSRPQPAGLEQLNSRPQLNAETGSSLPEASLSGEVELARAPAPNTTPEIVGTSTNSEVPGNDIARAPEATPVVGSGSTNSEVPAAELARAPEAIPSTSTNANNSEEIVRPEIQTQAVEDPRNRSDATESQVDIPRGNIQDRLTQTFLGGEPQTPSFTTVA